MANKPPLEIRTLPEITTEKHLLGLGAMKEGNLYILEDEDKKMTAGWSRGEDGAYYLSFSGQIFNPKLKYDSPKLNPRNRPF